MYMLVCMCKYVYSWMCVRVYVCMCECTYVCMCECTYVCMCECTVVRISCMCSFIRMSFIRMNSSLVFVYTSNSSVHSLWGWRTLIGSLIFIGHFPQKWPIFSGSFVENDLQLRGSYESSPPCMMQRWNMFTHTHHLWIKSKDDFFR